MRLSRSARAVLDKIDRCDHSDAKAFAKSILDGPIGRPGNRGLELANLCRAYLVLHIKAWPSEEQSP